MQNRLKTLVFISFTLATGNTFSQVAGDYRSFTSGTWATAANWETFDGTSWIPATVAPNNVNANVITVQAGHTMTISAILTVDQLVVNNAGIVIASAGGVQMSQTT